MIINMNISTQDKCLLSFLSRSYVTLGLIWLVLVLLPLNVLKAEDQKQELKFVTVKTLADIVVKQEENVPATVVSLNHPIISSEISAEVKKIKVDVGDNVKQGDVLLELDCRDYENALAQASATYLSRKAQLAFAEKTYKRNKKLLQQSTIPQNALDQAESEYLSVQAGLNALKIQQRAAKLNVERCKVKAPFSGQVTQRQAQKGQLVLPNSALFELLQTSNLQISAELSRDQVQQIEHAKILFFSVNTKNTPIHLHKVVSLIKESTRTQSVRFDLPEQHRLVTGTAGRVIWKSAQPKLPANFISQRNGDKGVLIVESDKSKVNFIPLQNVQEGQAAAINLPLNTLIIDKGRLTVQDQQVVEIK